MLSVEGSVNISYASAGHENFLPDARALHLLCRVE